MVRSVLVAFALLLAGCATAPDASTSSATEPILFGDLPDPLAAGPHAVATAAYDFGLVVATDPSLIVYRYPVQKTGSVHYPAEGDGPFPLILLMHGRHGTCAILGIEQLGTHVCPNALVVEPVNSFQGYDGLAANLASHGYVVASLNANQINDRDLVGDSGANARAELLLATLDDFATINADGGSGLDALRGRIDLDRIGAMGHSRGGEGVARAVTMNQARAAPHALLAIFALAPTDFARWDVPDVAFATLLPYCDGDVFNLQGAWLYDDARTLPGGPRHQVLAMGANHNYYNTIWTGDDWGTAGAYCGSADESTGRDTPEQQRAHGDGLMASFFRLYVGGEETFRPYWEEGAPWPDAMCPGWDGCAGRLFLSSERPAAQISIVSRVGMDYSETTGIEEEGPCAAASCDGTMLSVAENTRKEWSGPAAQRMPVHAGPGLRWVTLRVGVPVDGDAANLTVELEHAGGRVAFPLAGSPQLAKPPGQDNAKTVLNMLRAPIPEAVGSDGVQAVWLRFAGSGALHVADVMLQ